MLQVVVSRFSLQTVFVLAGAVLLLRSLQAYINFLRALKSIKHLPGFRTIVSPATLTGHVLPPVPILSLGRDYLWRFKHSAFAERGLDIISVVALWPRARVSLVLADAEAIKEVVWSRNIFLKPLHQYKIVSLFGPNIVVSEGNEWKRYRKIVASAFSDRNNRFVWEETTRIMLDLFDNVWAGKDEVTVDHGVDLTLPIALFVIGAAGFGRKISWQEDAIVPAGHQMTFKDALHMSTTHLSVKVILPKWAFKLNKRLQRIWLAFDELERYLYEIIQERKNVDTKEESYDLFNNLLAANDSADISSDDVKLTNNEVVGNIFIFLIAGHETTAHALCSALALLALYSDEQELLYQQIKTVLPDGRMPTYEDMPRLTRSFAVFNEALRMFAPVTTIPKRSAVDTTLVTNNALGGNKTTVTVPQGTYLSLDVPGLHYNPRYWEDPHSFTPGRFLGDWNRDAFLPFSGGYRGCVGRKFAETEGTAVLTHLIMRYKVEIKEEPQYASETFEQKKARILKANSVLTLVPQRVPLVFKRRK